MANIVPVDTVLTLGWGQKVKTFFSDSSQMAYQIKGNGAYGTTQASILSAHTSLAPGVGSKGQDIYFLNVVMFYCI